MAERTQRGTIKALTYLMFMMFALTTESVGLIIPEVTKSFHIGLTASGAFHYAPMTAIGLAGIGLGFLADRLGRKRAIMLGLLLFAANAFLFIVANSFGVLLALLTLSGVAIGIFKTGALALIGDISRSTREHTATMNMVEGFFGIGSIIGPAIVARLLQEGLAWKWLYVLAGGLCTVLVLIASRVDYPVSTAPAIAPIGTAQILRRPLALAFSLACFLYVALECSIYVWLPTYLLGGAANLSDLAVWAVPAFFLLRALGRFFGAWMLTQWRWTTLLMLFGGVILVCFIAAVVGGARIAALSLPLSGLFMSVVYPTLNSKGISCFQKSEHGAVAGVILFFSCLGAGLGPLAMGVASDLFGGPKYCFVLATLFAVLLFAGLVYNWIADPTRQRLDALDASDYHAI
jgi:fucose permease